MSSTLPRTDLYRAVRPAEASSIRTQQALTNPPGIETKYFAVTLAGARLYARKADLRYGDGPYRIVKTTIRSDLIAKEMSLVVDGGIRTIVLPTRLLACLTRPEMVE